jgi:hypothetical protein
MPIADESIASQEFLRVTFGDVSTAERRKVRNQLLRYCGQDTDGMIGILYQLWSIAHPKTQLEEKNIFVMLLS